METIECIFVKWNDIIQNEKLCIRLWGTPDTFPRIYNIQLMFYGWREWLIQVCHLERERKRKKSGWTLLFSALFNHCRHLTFVFYILNGWTVLLRIYSKWKWPSFMLLIITITYVLVMKISFFQVLELSVQLNLIDLFEADERKYTLLQPLDATISRGKLKSNMFDENQIIIIHKFLGSKRITLLLMWSWVGMSHTRHILTFRVSIKKPKD